MLFSDARFFHAVPRCGDFVGVVLIHSHLGLHQLENPTGKAMSLVRIAERLIRLEGVTLAEAWLVWPPGWVNGGGYEVAWPEPRFGRDAVRPWLPDNKYRRRFDNLPRVLRLRIADAM